MGKSQAVNTAGNTLDVRAKLWGNALITATDPSLCAAIGLIEAAKIYYSDNPVEYWPTGPNSNTFVAWLLARLCFIIFTAPPATTGWNSPSV